MQKKKVEPVIRNHTWNDDADDSSTCGYEFSNVYLS